MRAAVLRFLLRSITTGFFLATALLLLSQYTRTADWSSTLGRVDELAIVPSGDPDDSRAPGERFEIVIRYTYGMNGQEYEGSQVGVHNWIYARQSHAIRYLEQHDIQSGERVPVFVNPADPSESVLVRSIPFRRLEVLLVIVLLMILPAGVIVFSLVDLLRGGSSRGDDHSRGRFW